MKSVHNKFLTTEEKQKLISMGKTAENKTDYTKADFLTPGKVAEKYGISTEEAKSLMKKLKMHNASFLLNGRLAMLVVDLGKKGCLYLHPMGDIAFQKQLDKQKA